MSASSTGNLWWNAGVEAALPAVTETMKLAEQKKVGEALLGGFYQL